MIKDKQPWDSIEVPSQDYNVRKVPSPEHLSLYWGKDDLGQCLFIIELEGEHSDHFSKRRVSVNGMKIDLRLLQMMTQTQGLVITLENHVDRDLFFALCNTLINALNPVEDSSVALDIALAHINRWKAFMAGKKKKIMSEEEVRGLYSELLFLQALYKNGFSDKNAVDSWYGYDKSHQDFIFSNMAVEIKSISGRERSTVRISSEDQLETVCDDLYLVIYRLTTASPEPNNASSLNELVHKIRSEITGAEIIESFLEKLGEYGYAEIADYDEPVFIVADRKAFYVENEFPRIVRSELPDGICRVDYEIELEHIKPFECEISKIWS